MAFGMVVVLATCLGAAEAATPTATPTKVPTPSPTAVRNAFFYSVKFLCGWQNQVALFTKPGNYLSTVNIHNFRSTTVCLNQNVVLAKPLEQAQSSASAFAQLRVNAQEAVAMNCHDMVGLLGNVTLPAFVEIQSPVQLDVTAVYTSQQCSFGNTGACTGLGPQISGPDVVPESGSVAPAVANFCF